MAFRFGIALFAVLWIGLFAHAMNWNGDRILQTIGLAPKPAEHSSGSDGPSLGQERRRILTVATHKYVREGNPATHEMNSGESYAPSDFLNEELLQQGAKWRVRSTDGLDADIFEIS